MKTNKTVKTLQLVKRSDIITPDVISSKGVRVENGRGKVQFRPSPEMLGRKYGELIKTRTPARKRIVGGKAQSAKAGGKKTSK